jgi:hypothetical protein
LPTPIILKNACTPCTSQTYETVGLFDGEKKNAASTEMPPTPLISGQEQRRPVDQSYQESGNAFVCPAFYATDQIRVGRKTTKRGAVDASKPPNEQAVAPLPSIQHILDVNRLTCSDVGHHPDCQFASFIHASQQQELFQARTLI